MMTEWVGASGFLAFFMSGATRVILMLLSYSIASMRSAWQVLLGSACCLETPCMTVPNDGLTSAVPSSLSHSIFCRVLASSARLHWILTVCLDSFLTFL